MYFLTLWIWLVSVPCVSRIKQYLSAPKVAGYKINAQNPHAFLYTSNERSERKRNNPIQHCNQKNTILGIHLPKEAKDLDSENYKILMKEIKDNTNRWRDAPCSWIGWMNIVKMTTVLKAICRFNAAPIERKLLSLVVTTCSLLSWPSRCQLELHSSGAGRASCTATHRTADWPDHSLPIWVLPTGYTSAHVLPSDWPQIYF